MTMHTLQDLIALGETEEGKVKLRVMLAILLGWKHVNYGFGWQEPGNPSSSTQHEIPDYPNDLNACAVVEMSITGERILDYLSYLCDVCSPCSSEAPYLATALQRTIALILTLQKA